MCILTQICMLYYVFNGFFSNDEKVGGLSKVFTTELKWFVTLLLVGLRGKVSS